ncbi:MAG: GNAT family N-acetyltransferase [Sphaerochaetaceae bacterium]|nr:GNAT family N-acetyltransferase [Sphaerochaetaceae bacterium]MDC7238390.1 GNAT family N-acetyltransferase [Sphaerochaetaceae bacterium]MDC7243734.1 GNAT family N-acetyltransferase [Sphaerochaetaceae bacterium]MDC7248514.1 GNAT family N-acetyltransferase [Sphaerochaetaceae bacterium]
MGKVFTEKLESKRLMFRGFKESDAQDVFEYSKDKDVVKYLTWKAHKNINDTIESINSYLINPGIYAIVLKESEKVIGCIDISLIEAKKATFGYVLNKSYWNKGYMSETLSAFIRYLFDECGVEEIIGKCEKENIASANVMKKCNMRWIRRVDGEKINNKIATYDHYSIKKATN